MYLVTLHMHEYMLLQTSYTPPHQRQLYTIIFYRQRWKPSSCCTDSQCFESIAFVFIAVIGIPCSVHAVRRPRACCPHPLVRALINHVVYFTQVHDVLMWPQRCCIICMSSWETALHNLPSFSNIASVYSHLIELPAVWGEQGAVSEEICADVDFNVLQSMRGRKSNQILFLQ